MTSGPITKNAKAWAIGLMQIRVGECAANIASIAPVLTAEHSIGALANTKYMGSTEYFVQESGFPLNEDGSIPLRESAQIECAFKEITPYNMAIARGLDPTASVTPTVTMDVAINSDSGTRDTDLSITATDETIADEWTVVFTGSAAGSIFGKKTGHVHDFTALSAIMAPVDDNSDTYFSIPASFFTGTWAADDTYVFYTSAGGDTTYSDPDSGSFGIGGLTQPADVRVEAVYTFPDPTKTLTIVLPRAQAEASVEFDTQAENPAAPPIIFKSKNASSNNASGNAVWDGSSDAGPLGRFVWATN
ncbi:MAG: hypothetical protein PVI54_20930 [Desulfobacteraceae bacterium]|jgi:hypothetical protein